MALVLDDRVRETSTTTGTGTLNLDGAVGGFQTFVAGVGNSNTTYYAIVHRSETEWEIGVGTVTDASTDTLARTTVISSSNSDSAVNFSAGTKDVFVTQPASKAVYEDAGADVTLPDDLILGSDSAVLKFGADSDTTLTHTDGTGLTLNSTNKLAFQDTGTYIHSNADGDLDLVSDGTAVDSINVESAGGITLDAGTAVSGIVYEDDGTEMARIYNSSSDVILETKVSDKDFSIKGNDGGSAITALSLDMSAAGAATFNDKVIATELDISGDIDIDGAANLDNTDIDGTFAVDGTTISLDATTSLNIDNSNTSNGITIGTATSGVPISIGHTTSEVTVNDNLTVTGTLTLGSGAELSEAELEMLDGITAGTVAASKAVVVDSNKDAASFRNVTLTGELDAATLDISGNADIDGTTNLDAVDIDGNVQIDGTVTVGVDDTGLDVKFFGATSGSFALWDESADSLLLTDSTPIKVGDSQDMTFYHDGSNSYITNATGALKLATETSGIAITIGHSTSEVTVADNLTVTGDLTVSGTTTTVNSTTVNLNDHNIVLDSGNSTSAVVNGAGITLEGGSGDDATFTYNTSGPKFELKLGSSYEDLKVAQLIASSLDIDGTITVGVDDTGYDVKFFGATSGKYMEWDESADQLDVTASLDVTGNTSMVGTLTVGVDDTGHDVKFFGATSGAYLLWDESADKLLTAGAAVVDIVKDKLMIGGTAVTTTAAELNVLDAVTAGTVTASLGVVVDSNKDIGTFRNITLSGELDAGSLDVSGNADIDGTLEADAITINGTAIGSLYATQGDATALAIALG